MSEVKVDTISERTTDAGVTVEGVKIEDGIATFQTAAGSPLVFEGATADAFETTFAFTDPTADRTITFPDASVTLGAAQDNTPSFCAYNDTAQNLTSGAFTLVAANTEVYDTDSGYDTGTYIYTVPTAGKYFVFCGCRVSHSSGNNIVNFALAIYKDGTKDDGLYARDDNRGGYNRRYTEMYACTVLDLGVGDELKWYIESTENAGGGQYTTLDNNQYQNSWGAFKLAGV
jgi:hypothetical protein